MARVETVGLIIKGRAIHCSGCESRIQGTLSKVPGVAKVKADHKTQKISLTFDGEKTSLLDVLARLQFLGYDASRQDPGRLSRPDPLTSPQTLMSRRSVEMRSQWDTVCSVCTGGVSVICMSSMGVALAAAGTAGGAGAASMAGMGSVGSDSPGTSAFFLLPQLFDRLGLGLLNQVPNAVAQPLLVALLTISVAAAYLAYRGHRRPHSLALTLVSSIAMYVSIYVWMSEPLYFLSLAGLLAAGVWSVFLARTVSVPASGDVA